MLDSFGFRSLSCKPFVHSALAVAVKNLLGSESYGTPYAFCSFIEPRLPESLGWEGWIRTEFRSSLPDKNTSKRRSPWLCPAPSGGAGFFIYLCTKDLRRLFVPLEGTGQFILPYISRACTIWK